MAELTSVSCRNDDADGADDAFARSASCFCRAGHARWRNPIAGQVWRRRTALRLPVRLKLVFSLIDISLS